MLRRTGKWEFIITCLKRGPGGKSPTWTETENTKVQKILRLASVEVEVEVDNLMMLKVGLKRRRLNATSRRLNYTHTMPVSSEIILPTLSRREQKRRGKTIVTENTISSQVNDETAVRRLSRVHSSTKCFNASKIIFSLPENSWVTGTCDIHTADSLKPVIFLWGHLKFVQYLPCLLKIVQSQ
jgi:hypothetical protein